MEYNGFSGKIVSQKSPSSPDEKRKPNKGFLHSKICTLKKPCLGSSFRRLGCSAIRAETSRRLSPQARKTFLRVPLLAWKSTPHQLCGTTKEYRRYFHLYSRIIPYPFRFVNKIRTNVYILSLY